MLLITGPPGSGKTHAILESARESLRGGRADFRLLVPTSTMAEHLRNRLAREGFVFRSTLVTTLANFIEPHLKDLPAVPGALLETVAAQAVRRLNSKEFRAVAEFRGFHACLARLIEEVTSAGYDSSRLEGAAPAAFLEAFRCVEKEIHSRGMALRGERLMRGAERVLALGSQGARYVFADGFFRFAEPELALLDALRRHAEVTVTLPDWDGAGISRAALLKMGFAERRLERVRPQPRAELLEAPSIEQEVREIARRILDEAAAGRPFREIGIVLRSAMPYAPILRATLERFGIPARFYFSEPLSSHSLVRFLCGAVDAMMGGWDFEQTLGVLRLTASGLASEPELDRFDFRVRKRMPGRGMAELAGMAGGAVRELLDTLAPLSRWREARLTPLDWAARLKTLTAICRARPSTGGENHGQAVIWRSHAVAMQAFESAMEETAQAFKPAETVPLEVFWEEAKAVLRLASLRVEDRRRNVVHVLDVYEARQWELPVVFVCGLLEKHFPLHHPQDPILPDETRRRLRLNGVQLRTAADRDQEENFLFEMATSRATARLVLSYPRFNDKGDANLRSFFLDRLVETNPSLMVTAPSPAWRLEGPSPPAAARTPALRDTELLGRLRERSAGMAVTAIETFLQCPFQFFARKTLELESPPPEPGERLDMALQGSIAHKVLAGLGTAQGTLEDLFNRIFEEACKDANVPPGCQTESVRLELLSNLRLFYGKASLPAVRRGEVERDFRVSLDGRLGVHGRFDRVDFLPDGRAIVIDYKYSRAGNIRRLVKAHEEGHRVQATLYLIAAGLEFGREPAGFLFAGFRKDVKWDGWHVPVPGLEHYGNECSGEFLSELAAKAMAVSLRAAEEISQGRIAPNPAEPELCENCDFKDVCRVEALVRVVTAGEVEE